MTGFRRHWPWLCTLLALAAGPAFAAGDAKGASEPLFVAQILVLMLAGRLLGEVMLRFKQPAVMGQLVAGLMLGPSLFGAILPHWQQALFPAAQEQKAMLGGVAQFGILLLLLLTGMETDLKLVRQTGRASVLASLAGIAVPFVCGVALGELLPDSLLPDPGKRLVTALFLGTALSIASVKIVATVIREINFTRRTVGQVILASAIIDDTLGWIIIAIIFSLALQGHVDGLSIAKSVLGTLAFMGLSFTVGRRAVFGIIRWVNDTFVSEFAVITAILLIMCLMATITDLIGVHTVLGAFVAGILVGESPILTRHIDEQLRGLIIAFFMPVFFGIAGLSADLTILKDPSILALTVGLIVIASLGKFGGAFLGGRLGGLTFPESLALGSGMNARGSTEVIVATIGLSMGALNADLFTMIVTMAVTTTMAMPPTLRWALARIPMRKEEKQRLEREEMEARGFVPNLERLLVAVDDSANGKFATRIVGMLAGTASMPTTVLHITDPAKIEAKRPDDKETKNGTGAAAKTASEPPPEPSKRGQKNAAKAGETVKAAAAQIQRKQKGEEKTDAPLDVTTIVHEAPSADVIAAEAKKGYDLLVIGVKDPANRRGEFNDHVAGLALGFDGPLAIAGVRGELAEKPDSKLNILVPVNGTEHARRAAEVAITVARATQAPLTVLYVAARSGSRRDTRGGLRTRRHEEAILKDIVAIADGYNMSIRTALLADDSTDDAILNAAKRRKNNLIMLGVGRRPGEKLFFGDTAAALLEDADYSLLFVAS
jgi:Kef-type K+ transport system membrane component KefB/nucleotide-binding universal stress UspA family protein